MVFYICVTGTIFTNQSFYQSHFVLTVTPEAGLLPLLFSEKELRLELQGGARSRFRLECTGNQARHSKLLSLGFLHTTKAVVVTVYKRPVKMSM